MVTYRYVVYDILNDLKQVYDDADISPFKVFYWVCTFGDRLRKQHIEKRDSGAYVSPFTIAVAVEPINGRNYFVLPSSIYDFDKDNGIAYIAYSPKIDLSLPGFSSTTFTRTTPSKAARLYFREEETPSPSNPYFYRLSDRIYLLGVEQINITEVEAGLKTTLDPSSMTMDIDDEFPFPTDLLPLLKRQILDLGRFALNIPNDKINDGAAWDSKVMPTQKLISVNDPDLQQQQMQE
jgi:hypothetical protein